MLPERSSPRYVDAQTGEIIDFVAEVRRPPSRYQGAFALTFLAGAGDLARDPNLTDWDRTLLWALLGRLKYDNWVLVSGSELAEDLSRSPVSVSRAMSRLVKAEVLFRGPRQGNTYSYRLNPDIAFRGTPTAQQRVEKELLERGWEVVEGDSGAAQDGSVSGDQVLPGL